MESDKEEGSSGKSVAGLLDQFRSMDIVNFIGVEDFSDQLSYKFSCFLLHGLCTLTVLNTYLLHPVACFVPNPIGFSVENQYDYVNNYCWSEGTYAVHPANFSLSAELPDGGLSAYSSRKIVYYQWVPFALALQALLFYLPRLLWHSVSYDRAGTDVGHVVQVAYDAAHACGERHEKMVNHAAKMLDQMLQRNSASSIGATADSAADRRISIHTACRTVWRLASVVMPAKLTGCGLIFMYLVIKLAYLTNVLVQLSLMRKFLGVEGSQQYDMLGARLLWDVAHGRDWQFSGMFPRIGCCAVLMRTAASANWQFAQCILPVNMLNEKIYIFLWFWFIFVSAATIISLITWLVRMLKTSFGNHFVNRMLQLSDNYSEAKANDYVKAFCRIFLRRDGTFVLKMIALNCGDIVCSEIVHRLWTIYRKRKGFDHSACDLTGMLTLNCSECGSDSTERCGHFKATGKDINVLRRRQTGGGGTSRDPYGNATAPLADGDTELVDEDELQRQKLKKRSGNKVAV